MTSEESTDDLLRIKFQCLLSMFQCSAYFEAVLMYDQVRTTDRETVQDYYLNLLYFIPEASHVCWFVLAAAKYDILSVATTFLK